MGRPKTETVHSFSAYLRQAPVKRLVHRFNDELARQGVDSVAVIGPEPSGGRTFLVTVLAIGAALFLRKRVLIVNTANSAQNGRPFPIPPGDSPARMVEILNVSSLPGYDAASADLELRSMLRTRSDDYDLMLFDTAPLHAVGPDDLDPILVGKAAGGALLVLSNGALSSTDLPALREELRDWGIPLLGVVHDPGAHARPSVAQARMPLVIPESSVGPKELKICP